MLTDSLKFHIDDRNDDLEANSLKDYTESRFNRPELPLILISLFREFYP